MSEDYFLKEKSVKLLQQLRNVFYQSPGIKEFFYKENEVLMKNLTPDSVVLDVGCGFGTHVVMLSKYCKEVFGIDHSEAILKKCRKNVEGIRNVKILKMNAYQMDFPDNHFDETFSLFNTLGIMHKPIEALREMKRVTKKGGRLVFSLYNPNSIEERIEFYKKAALDDAHAEGLVIKSGSDFFSNTYTEKEVQALGKEIDMEIIIHETKIGHICEAVKK